MEATKGFWRCVAVHVCSSRWRCWHLLTHDFMLNGRDEAFVCFRGTRRVLWAAGTSTLRRSIQITWTTRKLCQSRRFYLSPAIFLVSLGQRSCYKPVNSGVWPLRGFWIGFWSRLFPQGCLPVRHQDVWGQKDATFQRDQREGRTGPTVEEDQRGEISTFQLHEMDSKASFTGY